MFSGSIVAILTPFKNDAIDKDAMAGLIEFQIENGTDGIVPCGTTGESATLSHDEHEEVIRFTIEQVRGRVPVIAGTGSNSTAEALRLTAAAREMKADGALLISPYYNKPTQEGIYRHYRKIAEETDFPLVLYNCPGRTGSSIAPETVARLAELPRVVGLKDAAGSIDYTSELRSLCDLDILSGNDSMNLPIIQVGGKGAISVLANIAPRQTAELVHAGLEGDLDKAVALHRRYFDICNKLFIESNPIPVKTAAAMLGLCTDEMRLPLTPMAEANRRILEESLRRADILQ